MRGNLRKERKVFPIIDFSTPDTLILKGTFVEFETSLQKSRENGYVLEHCDDVELLKAWSISHE
ncbi:MAG: hypothetical protein ACYCY2_00330 [Acidithiobacillus ferriphilus]